MKINKYLTAFIAFALAVPAPLFSQAAQGTSILEFVQTHAKPKSLFHMRGRLFNASHAGITSLRGIEHIEGIGKVWSLTATGNNIEVVQANTFNYPQFKKLYALDLSNNKISVIEKGACNGLENLIFLWLNGNQLASIQDDALTCLKKVKFVFIANNPGIKELKKQIQKQLPQANVYTVNVTQSTLKNAAIGVGIALVVISVALGVLAQQRREPLYTGQIGKEKFTGTREQIAELQRARTEGQPGYWQQQLMSGVRSQNLEQVKQALEQTKQAINIDTPGLLVRAIEGGNHDIILMLLEKGANPNVAYSTKTPLSVAVKKNDASITQLLLAKGANPDERASQYADTLLIEAILQGDHKVFDVLINYADVNQRGFYNLTPLMRAARKGDKYMVRKLLAKGADVNAQASIGGKVVYVRNFAETAPIIELIENAPGYQRPPLYQQAYEAEQALSGLTITLDPDVATALDLPLQATPSQILRVKQGASSEEINKAHRELARKWHPDKNQEQLDLANRVTQVLNNAKDLLLPK